MKKLTFIYALTMLLCMVSIKAKAYDYDFSEKNDDGVTIYYNITSSSSSLWDGYVEVTYKEAPTISSGTSYYYPSYSGDVVIPSTVKHNNKTYYVNGIGEHAFRSCYNLTSVTIPSGVKSIGRAAFSSTKLTEITIPAGVTQIEDFAFNHNNLKEVTIPSGVTSIGQYVFANSSALTSIVIPDKVTTIGEYAFYNCSALSEVTIGTGVTRIARFAFENCNALTEVTIPNRVQEIAGYAFAHCSALTKVTIGSGVKKIGDDYYGTSTFYGCNNLTSVTSLIEEPFEIAEDNFSSYTYKGTLYVPYGTMEKYKNTKYWSKFFDNGKVEESALGYVTISIDNEDGFSTYTPIGTDDLRYYGVSFAYAEKIAAYKASVNGSTIELTRVYEVAAEEGVLLRSLEGGAVTEDVLITKNYTPNEGNEFIAARISGVLMSGTKTAYVLSKVNGVVGFYKVRPEGTRIEEGKAYLAIENAPANAAMLSFVFDGETTDINAVQVNDRQVLDGEFYNLNGQRVAHPTKGLYLVNGKKVVVK